MQVHAIAQASIQTPKNRQRREVDADHIQNLAQSIISIGLIHPIVVRKDPIGTAYLLVAGECRLRALATVWILGGQVKVADQLFPEGTIPALIIEEMDPIDAHEMELDENIRRSDLTWQDRAKATEELFSLRKAKALRDNTPLPTVTTISKELGRDTQGTKSVTSVELIVARNLTNPEVAKAKTLPEAYKVLKRTEELKRSAEHARVVGNLFTSKDHTLIHSNCLDSLQHYIKRKGEPFDIILSDPPYGMGADEFGDAGGKARVEGHFYDDSYESWQELMKSFLPLTIEITKPQAHLYLFCDIDRFHELRNKATSFGWKCFRTPLIWFNPTAMRLPWIDQGPQRKYQVCLYAVKGSKPVTKIFPDLVEYSSDPNLNHPAQKPVALYHDLLSRSAKAGDSVIDPFCGTGTIFPAAHLLKVKATGIEMDESAYGIAAKRLGDLK